MWRKKKISVLTDDAQPPTIINASKEERKEDSEGGLTIEKVDPLSRSNVRNIESWSPQQVVEFLRSIQRLGVLRNYINLATFREIDGETLLNLEERDLEDLGIKKMHTKKLLGVIEEVRSLNETGHKPSSRFSLQSKIVGSVDLESGIAQNEKMKRTPGHNQDLPKSRQPGKLRWTRGDLIGQGAFGRVFKGFNKETGQMMAVKEISFSRDDSKFIHELANEVHVLRRLHHPNIVRYLGVEVDERHQFLHIFCEWVPCGSVASMIKQMNGPLPVQIVAKFTKQVVRGIEYLHKKEIVHRDIKGQNLLVDAKGNVKVADFGTAKELGSTNTASQENVTLRGTPYFMAPEVIMQSGHGRKADIWSLGATVMEMAIAEPPWKMLRFENQFALLMHIARCKTPPPFPDHAISLPGELKNFLSLCFERDPSMRPNATRLLVHPFIAPKTSPQVETDETMSTLTLGNVMKKIKIKDEAVSSKIVNVQQSDTIIHTIINTFDGDEIAHVIKPNGNSRKDQMMDCAVTSTAKLLNMATGPLQKKGAETEDELFHHIMPRREDMPISTAVAKFMTSQSETEQKGRESALEKKRLENEARQREMQNYMEEHQAELTSLGILR